MTRLPIYTVIIYLNTVLSSKFETVDIGALSRNKFDRIPLEFNFLDSVIKLKLEDTEVHIIGTHHASSKSADLVESVIKETKPSHVLLELDDTRKELLEMTNFELELRNSFRKDYVESLADNDYDYTHSFTYENEYENWVTNFENGLSNKWAFKSFANTILTVKPCKKCQAVPNRENIDQVKNYLSGGMDFRSGYQTCQRQNKACETVLIDRNITVSGLRFWNPLTFTDMVSAYFSFVKCAAEVTNRSDASHSSNEMTYSEVVENIGWLKKCLPIVTDPLISERDHYMALKILNLVDTFSTYRKHSIVVVIGAAHVAGVVAHFEDKQNMYKVSLEELETVPELVKMRFWPWVLLFIFSIWLCCCEGCCIPRIIDCFNSEDKIIERSDPESEAVVDEEERAEMVDRLDSVKSDSSSESKKSVRLITGSTNSVNADHNMNSNDLPPPPLYHEN